MKIANSSSILYSSLITSKMLIFVMKHYNSEDSVTIVQALQHIYSLNGIPAELMRFSQSYSQFLRTCNMCIKALEDICDDPQHKPQSPDMQSLWIMLVFDTIDTIRKHSHFSHTKYCFYKLFCVC